MTDDEVTARARKTLWQIAGGEIVWLTMRDAQALNQDHHEQRRNIASLHESIAASKKREAVLHERCAQFASQAAAEERRALIAEREVERLTPKEPAT